MANEVIHISTAPGVTRTISNMDTIIANLSNQGTLRFGPGQFDIDTQNIAIDGSISIVGAGVDTTTIRWQSAGTGIQVNDGGGITTDNWSLRDFTLDGNSAGAIGVTLGQTTTSPVSATKGMINNVKVTGFTTAGVDLVRSQINRFYNVDVSSNDAIGLRSDSGSGNTDTNFFGCYFRQNGTQGLYVSNGLRYAFNACIFELNGQEGVWLNRTGAADALGAMTFYSPYFEANNSGRAGTDHAQFRLEEDDGIVIVTGGINLIDPYFQSQGTDNWHVKVGRSETWIYRPIVGNATVLGTDTAVSTAYIRIWSQDAPTDARGWTLGGTSSNVIWYEFGPSWIYRYHKNDGIGPDWTVADSLAV
jgi:hypothetical protein